MVDPFEVFNRWCLRNGFRDVIESSVEDTDLARLDAAIEAFGQEDTQTILRFIQEEWPEVKL